MDKPVVLLAQRIDQRADFITPRKIPYFLVKVVNFDPQISE